MPTSRTTKKLSNLEPRERDICLRLKEARQKLHLDQSEVARRLGLKPHFISSIEKCRAPLRFDIALRFCREMLVNEEWLATGKYRVIEGEAKRRGVITDGEKKADGLHPLFFRLCADLWSENVTRTIPARTLFSLSFDNYLFPIYERLASQIFYAPRVKPHEHDGIEIRLTLFQATFDAWLLMLRNEAARLGKDSLLVQSTYVRALFETGDVLFKRFLGLPTPELAESRLQFLHTVTDFLNMPVGPLHTEPIKGPVIAARKTNIRK